jgi:hypothetical protein
MLQHPKIQITRVNFPKTALTSSENQDQKNRPEEGGGWPSLSVHVFQPNIWTGQLICYNLNTHNETQAHQKTDERPANHSRFSQSKDAGSQLLSLGLETATQAARPSA